MWDLVYDLFPKISQALNAFLRGFLPGWGADLAVIVLVVTVLLLGLAALFMVQTWLERKVIARMQDRYGPNRVGPLGMLQPVADGIKMFTKEDVTPLRADRLAYNLGPILIIVPAMAVYAVIPFGKGMVGADVNIGVLYLVAISSLATIALLAAGWGSNNKYSLLGGLRAAAQIVSYEVPMVLSMLTAVMLAGSMSMVKIVEAQGGLFGLGWYIFFVPIGPIAFLIYFTCGVAEVNRAPFDIPEAESEIVAGFHTEYSGMKFALFMMGEYIQAFAVSAIAVTLFLGGWQGPVLPPYVWFGLKTFSLWFVLMWLRGTLPRLRVDQLMAFAWKFLLPVSLANIFLTGIGISIVQILTK